MSTIVADRDIAIIADRGVAERLIAERKTRGWDRKDEVWSGTYIIMPDADIEHRFIVMQLGVAFSAVVNALRA
jgi:hypothetical protein